MLLARVRARTRAALAVPMRRPRFHYHSWPSSHQGLLRSLTRYPMYRATPSPSVTYTTISNTGLSPIEYQHHQQYYDRSPCEPEPSHVNRVDRQLLTEERIVCLAHATVVRPVELHATSEH